MKGRQTVEEELELSLADIPFEQFGLMAGQGSSRVQIGTLKALVRVGADGEKPPWTAADRQLLKNLKTPREFFVRVYVLALTLALPIARLAYPCPCPCSVCYLCDLPHTCMHA